MQAVASDATLTSLQILEPRKCGQRKRLQDEQRRLNIAPTQGLRGLQIAHAAEVKARLAWRPIPQSKSRTAATNCCSTRRLHDVIRCVILPVTPATCPVSRAIARKCSKNPRGQAVSVVGCSPPVAQAVCTKRPFDRKFGVPLIVLLPAEPDITDMSTQLTRFS